MGPPKRRQTHLAISSSCGNVLNVYWCFNVTTGIIDDLKTLVFVRLSKKFK
jgi:NifU-like protein involved in Fe-S cluster formation